MGLNDERAQTIDTTAQIRLMASDISEEGPTPFEGHLERIAVTFDDYVESIQRAKFVVCPRGAGHSSIRLFEAMQAGRAPVIISDEWLPPSGVDWGTCSVRIAEADVEALPDILREREQEAEQLGREARRVWSAHFSPERRLNTLARSCIEIHESVKVADRLDIAVRAARSRIALRRARVRITQDIQGLRARRVGA